MKKNSSSLKIGDLVKVREGTMCPDLEDLRIGGWQGRVSEIGEDELKEKIKEKSKETAKVFAKEIKNMTDDKILFLSILSIFDYFDVEFVRTTYQELVDELNLKDAWGFDRVLNWFKKDKINIGDKYIRFSHPSYSEALKNLLVEDGDFTRINKEIFSKLMLKLAEKSGDARYLALAVADNFYELPEDIRNKPMASFWGWIF